MEMTYVGDFSLDILRRIQNMLEGKSFAIEFPAAKCKILFAKTVIKKNYINKNLDEKK